MGATQAGAAGRRAAASTFVPEGERHFGLAAVSWRGIPQALADTRHGKVMCPPPSRGCALPVMAVAPDTTLAGAGTGGALAHDRETQGARRSGVASSTASQGADRGAGCRGHPCGWPRAVPRREFPGGAEYDEPNAQGRFPVVAQ